MNTDLEHSQYCEEDIDWVVDAVAAAVSAATGKLGIQLTRPLNVIYADADGLTSYWRAYPEVRAAMGMPVDFFTATSTLLPSSGALVIRMDKAGDHDDIVLAHAVLGHLFQHMLHSEFSCSQIEAMMEAAGEWGNSIAEAVEVLNRQNQISLDPLAALFAHWVLPLDDEAIPAHMTPVGWSAGMEFAESGLIHEDDLPLMYGALLDVAEEVFAPLRQAKARTDS